MRLFVLFVTAVHFGLAWGLTSPYPSSVPLVDIPNTHIVEDGLLRGMVPRTELQVRQLYDYGIKRILVFRNDSEGETGLKDEFELIEKTLTPGKIKIESIPFKWKDLTEFKEPCLQTLQALRFLRESRAASEKVFFHCTVGEDRTGLLAGVYRLIFGRGNESSVFHSEMCAHGYGRANPNKDVEVVTAIHENLTDLYVKMIYLIRHKRLTAALEPSVCDQDPALESAFQIEYETAMAIHYCPVVRPSR